MPPVEGAETSISDEKSTCEGGVLLRLRVLKEFKAVLKSRGGGKALVLGTVTKYRSIQRVIPRTSGRCPKIEIGMYLVVFDHGVSEQMTVDEVVKGANLFHKKREIALGFQSPPQGAQEPIISQTSGSREANIMIGVRLLQSHQNWPLSSRDLLRLDEERNLFWSKRGKGFSPKKVEPIWFEVASSGSQQSRSQGENAHHSGGPSPVPSSSQPAAFLPVATVDADDAVKTGETKESLSPELEKYSDMLSSTEGMPHGDTKLQGKVERKGNENTFTTIHDIDNELGESLRLLKTPRANTPPTAPLTSRAQLSKEVAQPAQPFEAGPIGPSMGIENPESSKVISRRWQLPKANNSGVIDTSESAESGCLEKKSAVLDVDILQISQTADASSSSLDEGIDGGQNSFNPSNKRNVPNSEDERRLTKQRYLESFSTAVARASLAAAAAMKSSEQDMLHVDNETSNLVKARDSREPTGQEPEGEKSDVSVLTGVHVDESNPRTSSIPLSLDMLAELAFSREAKEREKTSASVVAERMMPQDPDAMICTEAAETVIRNEAACSPISKATQKPALSLRGASDGSGDSIHRAGTPKSHNMLSSSSDDKTRRSRLDPGGPVMPELKEDAAGEGLEDESLPCSISQKQGDGQEAEHERFQPKPAPENDDHTMPLKRQAETTMDPPRALKRQRSVPGTRPPSIISRQRSTGSRLSFADEVHVAGSGGAQSNVPSRRKAPPVLRRSDREQSCESLQLPSVIVGGDRQSSVGSYASLRSQEVLTPNSRLTPSALGQGNASPNTDTPNTARMEDLYNQLDQYMESPGQSIAESPGHKVLPFRPRPMNARRQSSAASMAELDSQGELKLPPTSESEAESDTGRSALPAKRRKAGLDPLQIPGDNEIHVSGLGNTPTSDIPRSSLEQFTGVEQASTNLASQRKLSPLGQDGFQRDTPLLKTQSPQLSVKGDRVRPTPVQGESLLAWLGQGPNPGSTPLGMDQLHAPQPQRTLKQGPGQRSVPNQGQQYSYPFGIAGGSYSARGRMDPHGHKPYDRRQMSYDGTGTYKSRGPSQYEGYGQNGFVPLDPNAQRAGRRPEISQPRRKNVVEFGHPRDEVVEAQRIYSRHTLLLWGAHKSDICPVNGNEKEGCDSLIYINEADEVPRTKDDLLFLQFKCSQRNGGGALFANYQKSQLHNAPHSYPVRVFRKTTTATGLSGLRYDGLYSVAAIHDDRGRPRSEPSNSSTTFSFLLKRNQTGQAGDQNRCMLEELWDVVQQGRDDSPPLGRRNGQHVQHSMNTPLHVPTLAHGPRGALLPAHPVPTFPHGNHLHQQQQQQQSPMMKGRAADFPHPYMRYYGDQHRGMAPHQAGMPMSLQQRSQSMPVQPWAPHSLP